MPHSLLVFTRAHDYTSDIFEISDDEYDFEILRRVSDRKRVVLNVF